MGNQLAEKENKVALIHTLRSQSKQSEAIADALERTLEIEQRVNQVATDINDKMNLMQDQIDESFALHEDLSKQITINYDQQQDVKSIVSSKAYELAKKHETQLEEHFSDNMFKAWKGLFTHRIYSKLKKKMNVVRYTAVKKLDYAEATQYLNELTYQDFSDREKEPTQKILELLFLESEMKK